MHTKKTDIRSNVNISREMLLPARATRLFMRRLVLSSFIIIMSQNLVAQETETPATSDIREQQLEAITENNEDIETEDDSFLQSMRQFLRNPINLNTADISGLRELMVLTTVQVQSIISYRKLFGNFIHIYELQAVPGMDVLTIDRIRPYITVSMPQNIITSIQDRLKGGTNSLLARVTQVLEMQKGFTLDPASTKNYYPGSRQRLFVRYKYQFKNLLQYGIVGEKDAGEQFFRGAQKKGFDFYSAHLFARNMGIVKSLAIGDFTVNMGQGLTQWQSLAFKKGGEVSNVKRQLAVLRPYNSAGEINFHRGFGITVAKNNLEATVFASYKKVDANLVADTLNDEDFISSLQISGLHRTQSETEDKGIQRQFAVGGNLAYNFNRVHIGLNAIQHHFKLPIQKADDPYNLFALSGNNSGNYSVDYSYSYKNLHFFGEAAVTNGFDKAFVNGFIVSVDARVDISLLYRDISPRYQAINANAFTESTFPNNEKGSYTAIAIRPSNAWRIDAYADFYRFPWLRYLVDAPSSGSEFMLRVAYKPNKQLDMYIRYRSESKAKNFNHIGEILSPVVPKPRQNLRAHTSFKISQALTFRNRLEMVWFDKKGEGAQNGFLAYIDAIIKPMMKKYAGTVRLQYFETQGYDSRLYAFENDVLYSYSIPVFYDKGYRYYVNLNYDLTKKMTVYLRWAQTIYDGKQLIGSGLDEIKGNKRTELKVQAIYLF